MFGSLDIQLLEYEHYLVTIDTSTGLVTNVGETVEGLEAIAFLNPRVSNIPTMSEYGMIVLVVVLMAGAIFVLRRRIGGVSA
ncbi:MAG: IPTL-CTERM sorting domain-containing protein [Thermodesulfobacteriota bacterium]